MPDTMQSTLKSPSAGQLIDLVPEALQWSKPDLISSAQGASGLKADNGHPLWRLTGAARDGFLELLSESLGKTIGRLRRAGGEPGIELAQEVQRTLDASSNETIGRVISAPDVIFQLLFPRDRTAVLRLIKYGLDTETMLATSTDAVPNLPTEALTEYPDMSAMGGWTVAGDAWVSPSGSAWLAPKLSANLMVDFASPLARHAELHGESSPPSSWPEFSRTEEQLLLTMLQEGFDLIDDVNPDIAGFINAVARSVVPRKNERNPGGFGSSTTSSRIGQILITNPHIERINYRIFAETLVHEAIHSLLFMVEADRPWFSDDSRAASATSIVSPWSGAMLPGRNYVHACFVWFGLWAFWRQAHEKSSGSSAEYAAQRAQDCAKGYMGKPLLTEGLAHDWKVEAHVTSTISVLQHIVQSDA